MTTRYKTRAFVFKKNDINESDRIFSVFTDDFGRLDIFAKAIRKNVSKLRSGIDIFFMSEIEFIQGKNRKTLTDAVLVEKYNNIFQDLERFKIANKIGEVLDNFMRGEEKDKEIFDLLNESMEKLNECSPVKNGSKLSVYCYFLWNFISLMGYRPQVYKCNVCHEKLEPHNIYFSYKLGGIICRKCLDQDASAQKINSDIIKILRIILKREWHILSKLKIETPSQKLFYIVSENYYRYILSSHSFKNVLRVDAKVISLI